MATNMKPQIAPTYIAMGNNKYVSNTCSTSNIRNLLEMSSMSAIPYKKPCTTPIVIVNPSTIRYIRFDTMRGVDFIPNIQSYDAFMYSKKSRNEMIHEKLTPTPMKQ